MKVKVYIPLEASHSLIVLEVWFELFFDGKKFFSNQARDLAYDQVQIWHQITHPSAQELLRVHLIYDKFYQIDDERKHTATNYLIVSPHF